MLVGGAECANLENSNPDLVKRGTLWIEGESEGECPLKESSPIQKPESPSSKMKQDKEVVLAVSLTLTLNYNPKS